MNPPGLAKLIALLLLIAANGQGEKRVGGIIDRDTRWSADEGPFIVERDLLITKRAQLVIAPGTEVLVRSRPLPDTTIPQFDRLDSTGVSIRVEGALSCVGRRNRPVVLRPLEPGDTKPAWYGIIIDKAAGQFTEIAFTEVSGAIYGLTIADSRPLVRSSAFHYCHVGINCLAGGSASFHNCVVAYNFAAGIRVQRANPHISNSIIVFNRNNGLWCDGVSKVVFRYNCVYGNRDGNFLDCDPELGIISRANKGRDSTDFAHNIIRDPIFAGSASDSTATERDVSLPTDRSRLLDTALARVLYDTLTDSTAAMARRVRSSRYQLSRYSPCIDAGDQAMRFRDLDGSRNDIGLHGGPEFTAVKAH